MKFRFKGRDFAMTRKDAIYRLNDLGAQWHLHLHKIVEEPNALAADHWSIEMYTWWLDTVRIIMKPRSRRVSWELFYDQFLDIRGGFMLSFDMKAFNKSLKVYFDGEKKMSPEALLKQIKEHIV